MNTGTTKIEKTITETNGNGQVHKKTTNIDKDNDNTVIDNRVQRGINHSIGEPGNATAKVNEIHIERTQPAPANKVIEKTTTTTKTTN